MEEKPMTEIVARLQNISPLVSKTTLRQMSRIIDALLSMTGRITMLGLSRWTEDGGSYRTIQRWYHHPLDWLQMQWIFFMSGYGKRIMNTSWPEMKWWKAKPGKRRMDWAVLLESAESGDSKFVLFCLFASGRARTTILPTSSSANRENGR